MATELEKARRERRAQIEAAQGPVPESAERRREESLRILIRIARDEDQSGASRVAAATKVLDDARAELEAAGPVSPSGSSELMAALLEARGWIVEKPPKGA